jgi:cell division protein FtsW
VESFLRGGWFGRGPGEGTVKRILPDSHADFVFAVAAEEFGIVLCLALVALFCFIVLRALSRALRNEDAFTRFARRGSPSCSARNRRSIWRSTCISFRPRA